MISNIICTHPPWSVSPTMADEYSGTTMLGYSPLAYCGSVLLTVGALAWAAVWAGRPHDSRGKVNTQTEVTEEEEAVTATVDSFDISPLDECEFVPLLSNEEDKRIAAEIAPKTRYIQLDQENPTAHVNAYLDMVHAGDKDDGTDEDDDSVDGEVLQKAKDYTTDDLSKYINPKDLHALDDPRESPSRRGSVMSRVKKARQRAIRNAVERDMTAEDRLREQMAANQMLARVYTVMRENKGVFGDTSFEDVKSQMDMYKA